jgi:alkylation response protein AidB-like acyl-CoA dehydrogenase
MTAVTKPDHNARRRDFLFSDEHEMLRESMTRWAQSELAPHANAWEQDGFPNSVFQRMGELGYLGLCMPEEWGGQGGDYFYSLVRAEAMSHADSGGLILGTSVHTDMVMPPLNQFGTNEQKERYLTPSIAGEKIACLGISEPGAGSDVASIRTRALADGDDFIINGSKTFITNGARADYILLVAKTDPSAGHHGITLFLVDMDSPGVSVTGILQKMGMHASDTAEISFDDVRVPASAVLGEVGKGFYHISWELQGERLIGAAMAVGGAERVLEKTMEYARSRSAFGRPIGTFQAIRHKFAEMATQLEAARQLTYATAWRFQKGEYAVREASMAKLFATRMACQVADECLQIHGGYGYTSEYGIERAYRDLRLYRIGAGTDEIMLEVIGRSYGFGDPA